MVLTGGGSSAGRGETGDVKKGQESQLEEGFIRLWSNRYSDCPPVRQYRFSPPRRWRFDFAWLDSKVAVEIEGGMFKGGGHQRGEAYTKNCEKYNAAVVQGWAVLRYTNLDMRRRPVQVVEEVRDLITQRLPTSSRTPES